MKPESLRLLQRFALPRIILDFSRPIVKKRLLNA